MAEATISRRQSKKVYGNLKQVGSWNQSQSTSAISIDIKSNCSWYESLTADDIICEVTQFAWWADAGNDVRTNYRAQNCNKSYNATTGIVSITVWGSEGGNGGGGATSGKVWVVDKESL